MPMIQEYSGTPRRELHVFYVLDTSGSMSGLPIAKLNSAMTETIAELQEQAKHNADALVKLAVMEFNTGCRWVTQNGPEELEDFVWQKLSAGGWTDMGAALKELNSKLSRNAFLSSMTGSYVPVIIFMTDGCATDTYKPALEEIRQNKWFQNATKIGFAIGEEADKAMIADVVGTSEAVISTDDLELFAKLLKFVSVTATMLASQSQTTTEGINGEKVVELGRNNGDIPKPEPEADPSLSSGGKEENHDDWPEGDGWNWGDDFD